MGQRAAVFHLRLHGSMRPCTPAHLGCHICLSPTELFQLRVRRLNYRCRVLHALVQPTPLLKTSSHRPLRGLPSFQAALVIEALPLLASSSIFAPIQYASGPSSSRHWETTQIMPNKGPSTVQ